jgi:hypothetical protein
MLFSQEESVELIPRDAVSLTNHFRAYMSKRPLLSNAPQPNRSLVVGCDVANFEDVVDARGVLGHINQTTGSLGKGKY